MKFKKSAARFPIALLAIAAAASSPCFAAEPGRTMSASTHASLAAAAKTQVQGQDAELAASFAYDPAKRVLRVDYRLRNTGAQALAVFDRGDRHALASGRQKAGAIAAPTSRSVGDDVVLEHIALPLPRPAPVSPPTPLAAKLAAGAQSNGHFEFALPGLQAPKRLRWCLGVAAFAEADFNSPEQVGDVEIWRASFAVAERQQTLCTPWFDVARMAFES